MTRTTSALIVTIAGLALASPAQAAGVTCADKQVTDIVIKKVRERTDETLAAYAAKMPEIKTAIVNEPPTYSIDTIRAAIAPTATGALLCKAVVHVQVPDDHPLAELLNGGSPVTYSVEPLEGDQKGQFLVTVDE